LLSNCVCQDARARYARLPSCSAADVSDRRWHQSAPDAVQTTTPAARRGGCEMFSCVHRVAERVERLPYREHQVRVQILLRPKLTSKLIIARTCNTASLPMPFQARACDLVRPGSCTRSDRRFQSLASLSWQPACTASGCTWRSSPGNI
jgi:hypothetical protein